MAEQTGYAGQATVLPFDVQEAPKTVEVETVEPLRLSGIGCPGLATV